MNKFHDLTFTRKPDGSIRLIQSDCSEDSIIDLHPAQLRYMAESFGLVAPNHQDDELSKRLARQLCTIQRELVEECHRSHLLEMTFIKLDSYCASIPDAIFPHDLWDDDAASVQESPPAHRQDVSESEALPKPSIGLEPRNDGQQLGLAV